MNISAAVYIASTIDYSFFPEELALRQAQDRLISLERSYFIRLSVSRPRSRS